jgi:hypothetical protein
MTSSDQQAMADRTSTKRKHVTSCNIFPKRCKHVASSVGSVDTQFLEYKHVASNEGSVEHHERVEKQVTSCNRQSVGETSSKLKPISQTRDLRLTYLF